MRIPGIPNFILHSPAYLLLLLCIPLLFWLQKKYHLSRNTAFHISTTKGLKGANNPGWKVTYRPYLTYLRMAAFVLLVLALSRPQQTNVSDDMNSEGIDIVLSMDLSKSMLAEDFKPNRIEAAKEVAEKFVLDRPADRIGLVVFAGESFTQSPITIDHNVIIEQLNNLQSGMLTDGTAIGMGLATAVDRLRHTAGKSKVVILLTDGVNNSGIVDPETALKIAQTYKVRVYTIGVGSRGNALYPVADGNGHLQKQVIPVQIDETLLTRIAKETGGKYFRATDNASLQHIYQEIDRLEKNKMEVNAFRQYKEWYLPIALIAVLLLIIEVALSYTVFKSIT
ncbi:aerotolerance regulator BatA [Taibaiella sp. KBW10]|uniref:vWA domain-containing protein n=1 Tax=Taibaiella sp. KBW10 TaxID=2153357 RepID=UPI000F59BAFB|nr:VWA domain-containing protein [Taibaiella sp. KBW10]RQO29752.1 aerotolerance regulator BatA [Taibaiella sp. KBW10]